MYQSLSFLLNNQHTIESFVASVTQAQGNGVVRAGVTRFTVGTNDDALTLPTARKDVSCILMNVDNTQRAELWPSSGDRINGGSIDASIKVTAQQIMWLQAFDDTDWWTIYKTPSFTNGVVAFATGGQASATLLDTDWSRITTVVTDGDSVKLPVGLPTIERYIYNDDLGQSCDCFPASGGKINSLSTDAAIAIPAKTSITLRCFSTTQWHTET